MSNISTVEVFVMIIMLLSKPTICQSLYISGKLAELSNTNMVGLIIVVLSLPYTESGLKHKGP